MMEGFVKAQESSDEMLIKLEENEAWGTSVWTKKRQYKKEREFQMWMWTMMLQEQPSNPSMYYQPTIPNYHSPYDQFDQYGQKEND